MSRPGSRKAVKTSYTSRHVDLPPSFLANPPPDPISVSHVHFSEGGLPEYEGHYAVVLDGVLTPSECTELLRLCEESIDDSDGPGGPAAKWRPAMINVGSGYEAMVQDYRHCDRIIWDNHEMVKRIWERCAQAESIQEELAKVEGKGSGRVQGTGMQNSGFKWRFVRLNERMRFLRYGKGMFFKEHFDGTYIDPETRQRSFYTLHLYLNDSASESETDDPLTGGATTFHSGDLARNIDVDPRAGRVLIFQHNNLMHSGAEVFSGIKYTMRTDLMFELVSKESSAPKKKFINRFGRS